MQSMWQQCHSAIVFNYGPLLIRRLQIGIFPAGVSSLHRIAQIQTWTGLCNDTCQTVWLRPGAVKNDCRNEEGSWSRNDSMAV